MLTPLDSVSTKSDETLRRRGVPRAWGWHCSKAGLALFKGRAWSEGSLDWDDTNTLCDIHSTTYKTEN